MAARGILARKQPTASRKTVCTASALSPPPRATQVDSEQKTSVKARPAKRISNVLLTLASVVPVASIQIVPRVQFHRLASVKALSADPDRSARSTNSQDKGTASEVSAACGRVALRALSPLVADAKTLTATLMSNASMALSV